MRLAKCFLILIFVPFALVTCKTATEQGGPGALLTDRIPAVENIIKTPADKLIDLAASISIQSAEQGNLENQILRRFVKTAKYYSIHYPNNSNYVTSLFDVYKQLINDSKFNFLSGSKQNNKELDQLRMKLVTEKSSKNINFLRSKASVTYLRFFSNKIALALSELAPETSANVNYVKLRNYFVSIHNEISGAIFIHEEQKLIQKIQKIVKSKDWKNYQALATKTYVGLSNSSDIDGVASDLDKAEAITSGHYAMQSLFKNILEAHSGPVGSDLLASNFFPENTVLLEKTPYSLKKNKRNLASINLFPTILVGNIPGQYLGKSKNEVYFGYLEIKERVITELHQLEYKSLSSFLETQKGKSVILLKNKLMQRNTNVSCMSCQPDYDVIYPGLINLHNHTKQNNLPIWGLAKGQFLNRFEWRDWDLYTKSVSQNMNPWIQYGKPIQCAAFRWSEMQAMINGTTYLQGPSMCVSAWGVLRVEDQEAYISQKEAVQAPTDILLPNDMVFVWQTLKPIIESGKTYEQALAQVVQTYCPSLAASVTAKNINHTSGLSILTNKELLETSCGKEPGKPVPAKFIRYAYWIHPSIAIKKNYLLSSKVSAVIAHLAEGSRTDSYNSKEYEVLKLLGLNMPHISFVHGIGIQDKNYSELVKNEMGLIWSPFSNLILYGETLNIKAAAAAGVVLALGSDWLPTGSKGVLEEVKLAARYIDQNSIDGRPDNLKNIFTDEYLFKMMTENPAKIINHSELSQNEAPVGRLQVGAMGSVIVTSLINSNPYTNIVRHVFEKEINLVVIDGQPIYGNSEYLDQAKLSYEVISRLDGVVNDGPEIAFTEAENLNNLSAADYMGKTFLDVSKFARQTQLIKLPKCDFKIEKGFVKQDTLKFEPDLELFYKNTNLNLDRFEDIQKILAVNLLNQSLNKISKDGDRSFAVSYFPSLYSCNDEKHLTRFSNYVKSDGNDELKTNIEQKTLIRKALSGKVPAVLAEQYK
ncbi:MAG: amidohydrolase family protein [Pseudobdellovibrio sp.]